MTSVVSHRRFLTILSGLLLLAVLTLFLSLTMGSVNVFSADASSELSSDILWQLRLPRALTAFAVGGLLALSGALLQVLLRNPLADPYVLGISGGAGVGALLSMLFAGVVISEVNLSKPWLGASFGAALGALFAITIVFGLVAGGKRDTLMDRSQHLLLTGIAMSSLAMAIESAILALAPDKVLRGMIFWLLGDLTGAAWLPVLGFWLLASVAALGLAPSLNVLLLGPLQAKARGVSLIRVEIVAHLLAALATAVAVVTAGSIGFVGLLVPHFLRLWLGNDQRLLLPAAALGGGVFLVWADTLSRWFLAPQQLPIGVVTALIGVPAFLWILHRKTT